MQFTQKQLDVVLFLSATWFSCTKKGWHEHVLVVFAKSGLHAMGRRFHRARAE